MTEGNEANFAGFSRPPNRNIENDFLLVIYIRPVLFINSASSFAFGNTFF